LTARLKASERRQFGSIKLYRRRKSAVGARLIQVEISNMLQAIKKPSSNINPAIASLNSIEVPLIFQRL
jgi:hypothetical protein